MKYKKILILGSGAIKIGQAGEFDYSGSQAIKALKEERIETILINPNIATIQTSENFADRVYFEPITPYFVEKVIEKERPDGILLGFGGQTALNAGLQLDEMGVFEKWGVEVLGTSVETILKTEDRQLFNNEMKSIGLKVPQSKAVTNSSDALAAAKEIGFPVMIRAAFALGGLGSGVIRKESELVEFAKKALSGSEQILVEEYLGGWKEIEYEVVRDRHDNCIVVCTMENLDPMGIHTGESIVVAPVQTLTAHETFRLRAIAIEAIRHLNIIGECNIQYAFDPHSDDYRIIEVNPRLSRSSALASKATGYPLAFIAAKLSVGHAITDMKNIVTEETSACFEPALDYIVVKYPRWDLHKFKEVNQVISSEMKSVGEIMSIARSFEEALQKSIRMLDMGMVGLTGNDILFENVEDELQNPTDRRMFAIAEAFRRGYTVDEIYELTKITRWFLYKIKNIMEIESLLKNYTADSLPRELFREAKQKGFSDSQLAKLYSLKESDMRSRRKKEGIIPCVKQIDTLAAEYPAMTNYLYLTYNGDEDDIDFSDTNKVIVLGSGAYKIGSSVEFDWCCVNAMNSLREMRKTTIMINYNPETVSTDYDMCDKLYFDELTLERVLDITDKESPDGVIVSTGGQIPNNLAFPLHKNGVTILGTSPVDIDRAEDRHKFSSLLDDQKIDQPAWDELSTIEEAEKFADKVGYPVLIRPSYVLSGAAMTTAWSKEELTAYISKAAEITNDHPVVISKFITGAREIELDGVAGDGDLYCYAVSEHVENAGVHSGDATVVLPPQRTYLETMRRIKNITKKITKSLNITGPFNIQFIAKDNEIKVIECNLRASRSFPFVSKVYKMNFIDAATKLIMGKKLPKIHRSSFDMDFVGVKAPQFSFTRLKGSDPVLGVEMASTGEVGCIGEDVYEAFLKSMLSVGFTIPKKNILLSTGSLEKKISFLESVKKLVEMEYNLFATKGTAEFLEKYGIKTTVLHWPDENKEPKTTTMISEGKIDLVINIPKDRSRKELSNDYEIRRKSVDFNIPLITKVKIARTFVESIYRYKDKELGIKAWDEY